jgi:hypothetical protein
LDYAPAGGFSFLKGRATMPKQKDKEPELKMTKYEILLHLQAIMKLLDDLEEKGGAPK